MFKKNNNESSDSENKQGTENGNKRRPLIERLGLIEPVDREPKLPKKIMNDITTEKGEDAFEAASSLGLSNLSREEEEEVSESREVFETLEALEKLEVEEILETMEVKEIFLVETLKEENPTVEEINEITYSEKKSVREIYGELGIDIGDIGTIYMVENFINALPSTLPQEIKRQSLKALIQASHLDMRVLLKDGDERLKVLSGYKSAFESSIANAVAENERYIARLNEEIAKHKGIIDNNLAIKEAQHFEIEFEVQRLTNIIGFVKSDK